MQAVLNKRFHVTSKTLPDFTAAEPQRSPVLTVTLGDKTMPLVRLSLMKGRS